MTLDEPAAQPVAARASDERAKPAAMLVTGWGVSEADAGFGRLTAMGLRPAAPTRRTGYGPEALTRKMQTMNAASQGVPPAWQLAISDLTVENAGPGTWGWCDPNGLRSVRQWREQLGALGVLIVFSRPAEAIAARLMQTGWSDADGLIDSWKVYYRRALDAARGDDALLVHQDALGSDAFAEIVAAAFGLEGGGGSSGQDTPAPDPLLTAAVRGAVRDEELDLLYEEVCAVAALGPDESGGEAATDLAAIAAAARSRTADASKDAVGEPDARADTSERGTSDVLLEDEAALLKAQLAQAHEELRGYFVRAQAAGEAAGRPADPSVPSRGASATDVNMARAEGTTEIDLRGFVDGEGWYHAEEDGRWAGPSPTSSLRLTPLPPGRYRVEVVLVDSMADDIARGLSARLGEAKVRWSQDRAVGQGGALAPLRRLAERMRLRGGLAFPRRLAGNVTLRGGTDMLTLEAPRTVSPAETGSTDTRQLSVRVRSVAVTPLGG